MALMPNFPLLMIDADLTGGPPNEPGSNRVSLNGLGMGVEELVTSRGRQYELGHCEAGTAALRINDPGELLNPVNTSSPLNTGANELVPYRALRVSALWPLTGNINNAGVDVDYDPGFESGTLGGWTSPNGSTALTNSTAQAFEGTRSLHVVQAGAGAANGVRLDFPAAPGTVYTVSAYVYIPAAPAGTTVQLQLAGAGASVTSSVASTTGVWQRLTATYTAAGAVQTLTVIGAGNATPTYFVDAVQLELSASASAYVATGPAAYAVHTGYIERYPQTWRDQGMWGVKPLESVDALAVLSRTIIRQSYLDTISADGPLVVLPYDDTSAPQRVLRGNGGVPSLGYFNLGQSGQVNYGGETWLDGSRAIDVVQQNTNPVTSGNPAYITYAGTRGNAMSMNPQAFTLEVWLRFSAGTVYLGAASVPSTEDPNDEAAGPAFYAGWFTSAGILRIWYADPNGGVAPAFPIGNGADFNGYPDGKWHYLALVFPGGSTFRSVVDSAIGGAPSLGFAPSSSVALTNFFLDATTYFRDALSKLGAAYMAAYPTALTSAQLNLHYRRGIGYRGELSGSRAERLLDQYWQGPALVDGPGVVPMSPDYGYDGRDMLSVLTEISETENGLTYVRGDGTVVVEDRDHRYRQQTPQWTFGERADLGEYPYANLAYDYDPTYVYSEAQITAGTDGPTYSVVNQAALARYGQRIFRKTLHTSDPWVAEQAAIAFAQRYGTPRLRVKQLVLDPVSNPALWPVVLGLEISQRVTVNRRANGVTMSADFYVERIDHGFSGGDSWGWTTTVQLSPVFVDSAWILGDPTYGVLGSTTVCVY